MPMQPKNVLYYGKDEELPPQVSLRAGPLALIYEQGDLRRVCLGDTEILRRIYVAVRNRNWDTVSPVFLNVDMQVGPDSFQITYQVENRQAEIDFAWLGSIRGEPDGTITFCMEGEARSTFWRNRIGFCVLHPASLAGQAGVVVHADGVREEAVFPVDLVSDQPVRPFADIATLSHKVVPGLLAEVVFSGDVFEMEDQRNWTDASYKTFSTPLRLPFPVEIRQGTRVAQMITLRLRAERPAVNPALVRDEKLADDLTRLALPEVDQGLPIPAFGLGMASHGLPLSETELGRIRALNLSHLRVDLALDDPGWKNRLRLAAQETQALGTDLVVGLLAPDSPELLLETLRAELDRLHQPVSMLLCYPAVENFKGGSPITAVVQAARKVLDRDGQIASFAAGTNTDIIFMMRSVPPLDQIQALTFAINPQVHAFDNTSLVETLQCQGDAVRSARRLGGSLPARGLPVWVSPVTLKMRFNPYATGNVPPLRPDELPPQVDPRQMSLFGAAWTLGSFKYLAEADTSAVTYFETSGWRGVLETEAGSPLPSVFRSVPGSVFPLYHVLADIGEFVGGQCIPLRSSQTLKTVGVKLLKGQRERLLVANLTPWAQKVQVQALPGQCRIQMLDETSFGPATLTPETFRALGWNTLEVNDGGLVVSLLPYALACLDRQGG